MTPFQTARGYLNGTPGQKWAAIAASVAAAVLTVLLLPVVYLFADHLVWKGAMPTYDGLHPNQQAAFQQQWETTLAQQPGVTTTLDLIRPPGAEGYPGATKWEWRWQAVTHKTLADRVGPAAADAYLPLAAIGASDKMNRPTGDRLGILSLVARDRSQFPGGLFAWLAKSFGWTWRPDAGGDFNPAYLTGLFVVALLIAGLLVFCLLEAEHTAAAASLDAVGRLRRAVFAHAARLGNLATKRQAAAEVSDVFVDEAAAVEHGLRHWMTGGFRGPVLAVLLVLSLLAIHFWLGLSLILLGAVVWLVGGQVAAGFRRDGRIAARRAEARLAQMRESLSMIQLVKCYLMERFNQTRVERQLTDYTRSEWRRLRGEALSGPLLTGAGLLAAVVMLYIAGRAVIAGEFTAAGLVTKAVAIAALVPAVRTWIDARLHINRAKEASATVAEFLDRRVDAGQPIDAEFLQPMSRKLEFVDVSYREPGTGRMMVENLSLSVPLGGRAVVLGSDPEEVLSVAYLLTRFLDPTAGEVRIDGKNLRWVTHESLRTQVALVSQQNLVFNDTVANNIACGDPGFTLPQVIEAAKVAHAHQFVQRLPYGYETAIGDAGVSLKPGEKLRVAIARAILRDPSLLVVEEPDEPLDHDTKALLDDTFARAQTGRALVILTRRASVLRSADQVLVVHDGRIAAAGTHDALMRSSDLYRGILFQELPLAATA